MVKGNQRRNPEEKLAQCKLENSHEEDDEKVQMIPGDTLNILGFEG